MRRLLSVIIVCSALFCGGFVFAQPAAKEKSGPILGDNSVKGLTLPASKTVNYDEGFVTLTADTKGSVKWLVLSTSAKVKFRVQPSVPNEITVAVPPFESAITVFAIAVVDGKQTDFARTDILVKGPAPPRRDGDAPSTIDVQPPFHLSIIEDADRRTPGTRSIVDNPELRDRLQKKQVQMRVYPANDGNTLRKYRFDAVLKTYGAPLMILQDKTGKALLIEKLPADQAALLKRVGPMIGGI